MVLSRTDYQEAQRGEDLTSSNDHLNIEILR